MVKDTDGKTTFQVRVDTDFLIEFDAKCKEEHRDRSKTIKMLMENYLKQN